MLPMLTIAVLEFERLRLRHGPRQQPVAHLGDPRDLRCKLVGRQLIPLMLEVNRVTKQGVCMAGAENNNG